MTGFVPRLSISPFDSARFARLSTMCMNRLREGPIHGTLAVCVGDRILTGWTKVPHLPMFTESA